jgi:flagellar basal-body rod modification protein FlgD
MTSIATSPTYGDLGSSYQLAQTTKKASKELGQEEFLNLMITQFRNQDPLKPQDPTEFLSQLAQITSVSGIAEMKTSITRLADSLYAGQALQAAGVVGREVLAPSDSATLQAGGSIRGAIELPESTQTGVVSVLDDSGALVRTIPLGLHGAGLANFTWNGTNSAGTTVAPGDYRFVASYQSGDEQIGADTYITKRVASVALGGDGQRTEITTSDNQKLALSNVRAIF